MFWWTKWMLTVKLVYKLSNVPDNLKWAKNTHVTPFTLTFKEGITNDIYHGFWKTFLAPFTPFTHISTRPPIFLPVLPYFYPSIFVFTRPNDGWSGLYIKLCFGPNTACVIRRETRCRAYRNACVGLPNPTFWQRNLSSLKWDQITQSAQILWFRRRQYRYPPGLPGCNPRGDRANKS